MLLLQLHVVWGVVWVQPPVPCLAPAVRLTWCVVGTFLSGEAQSSQRGGACGVLPTASLLTCWCVWWARVVVRHGHIGVGRPKEHGKEQNAVWMMARPSSCDEPL
jgi:hypothetical protein